MSSTPKHKEKRLGVSVTGTPEDGHTVLVDHSDSLQAVFGTDFPELADALLGHCMKVLNADEASDRSPGHDERFFMLAAISELKPRDMAERLLCVQMAATHVALVRAARKLAFASSVPQTTAHYNGYSKLARIYAAQMAALQKHRTGGKQTVTVQHVNVEGGGQAIVGHVEAGGRGNAKK